MEADLRLMLLSLGVIFLVWIVVDAYRRRPAQQNDTSGQVDSTPTQLDEKSDEYRPTPHEGVIGKPRKVGSSDTISFQAPAPTSVANSSPRLSTTTQSAHLKKSVRFKHEKSNSTKPIGLVIVSAEADGFEGARLHAAIEREKLSWDEKGIYHRHKNNNIDEAKLFTVAQTGQPGTFSTASRYNQRIQAILLIQDAPGNIVTQDGLEDLLLTAYALAKSLGGKICRLDGKKLELSDINDMKSEVNARSSTVTA